MVEIEDGLIQLRGEALEVGKNRLDRISALNGNQCF
jgi:hypothetical protein